jgi:hypothetical protein
MPMAILLNLIVVSFLVREFWRVTMRPDAVLGETVRPFAIGAGAVVATQILWLAVAKARDAVFARLCPQAGDGHGAGICGFDIPATLFYGAWPHYVLFFAILAACSALIHAVAARMWVRR